jgi:hypothetical protein
MIDWLWIVPAFLAGFALGWGGSKRYGAGVTTGIIGTILAFFWLG